MFKEISWIGLDKQVDCEDKYSFCRFADCCISEKLVFTLAFYFFKLYLWCVILINIKLIKFQGIILQEQNFNFKMDVNKYFTPTKTRNLKIHFLEGKAQGSVQHFSPPGLIYFLFGSLIYKVFWIYNGLLQAQKDLIFQTKWSFNTVITCHWKIKQPWVQYLGYSGVKYSLIIFYVAYYWNS